MVLCQGTADGTVPYDCDVALRQYLQGYYTIKFCGSGEMAPKLDSVGVNYSLMPFPGSGHVPWDTNVIIQHEMDSAVAAFFYAVNCVQTPCIATGIAPLDLGPQVSVYPNPAHNALHLNVTGDNGFSEIRIYDCTGRLALQQHIGGKQVTLLTEGLAAGIYTLRIGLKDPNMQPVIRMVAIE